MTMPLQMNLCHILLWNEGGGTKSIFLNIVREKIWASFFRIQVISLVNCNTKLTEPIWNLLEVMAMLTVERKGLLKNGCHSESI